MDDSMPQLRILVVDKLLELNEFLYPIRTFKKIISLKGYDMIIVPVSINEISIYLLETSNTLNKHSGQWRQIMFIQEEKYEYKDQKFSYFNIPRIDIEIMVSHLKNYFDLTVTNDTI